MSLDGNVQPAVLSLLRGLSASGGGPLFKGVSDGSTLSVPLSPWCWVEHSSMVSQPAGSDLESTTWELLIRMLFEWAPDQWNAETQLAKLIEPVRAGVRAHIRMGQSTIVTSYVGGAQWGYMLVNGVTFRNCDLTLRVTEKVGITAGA